MVSENVQYCLDLSMYMMVLFCTVPKLIFVCGNF